MGRLIRFPASHHLARALMQHYLRRDPGTHWVLGCFVWLCALGLSGAFLYLLWRCFGG